MSHLVTRLTEGQHSIRVSLRPEPTLDALKACLDRGYVHIRFPDTRGGTELGVTIDRQRSNLDASALETGSGEITIIGDLSLDFVPVVCVARVDLATLEGVGHLETAAAGAGATRPTPQ